VDREKQGQHLQSGPIWGCSLARSKAADSKPAILRSNRSSPANHRQRAHLPVNFSCMHRVDELVDPFAIGGFRKRRFRSCILDPNQQVLNLRRDRLVWQRASLDRQDMGRVRKRERDVRIG
jgi:hypothetical protein